MWSTPTSALSRTGSGSKSTTSSLIDRSRFSMTTTLMIKTKKPTTSLFTAYVYIIPEHI